MMGTLAAVLAGRKIRTHPDRYRADVEGDIRESGGVLRITDIRVRYSLTIPSGQESNARWGFDHYLEKCPAAQSVIGCIHIDHELKIEHE
jgi:organic hydroperoxide reductase OsmC/OhrA